MFDNLSDRLQGIFSGLRGKGRLTEDDIDSAMREVRMALLEADVNFKVVKQFVARTKERCLDAEVLDSLSPDAKRHQDRHRRAHRAARPHRQQAGALQPHPQRHHAGGPAGLRQDHRGRQAGVPSEAGRTQPAAGRLRRLSSRRSRPAGNARQRNRRACVPRRRQGPGGHRQGRRAGRHRQPARRGHRRHGGSFARGRADDGRGPGHQVGGETRPDPHGRRCHDRPGRGQRGRCLLRARRFRRRHHVEDGRRRPRRRRAVHPRGHGQAHQVHQRRREARFARGVPSRPHGPPHPGHGRHAQPHRVGGEGPAAGRGAGRDRTSHEKPSSRSTTSSP